MKTLSPKINATFSSPMNSALMRNTSARPHSLYWISYLKIIPKSNPSPKVLYIEINLLVLK